MGRLDQLIIPQFQWKLRNNSVFSGGAKFEFKTLLVFDKSFVVWVGLTEKSICIHKYSSVQISYRIIICQLDQKSWSHASINSNMDITTILVELEDEAFTQEKVWCLIVICSTHHLTQVCFFPDKCIHKLECTLKRWLEKRAGNSTLCPLEPIHHCAHQRCIQWSIVRFLSCLSNTCQETSHTLSSHPLTSFSHPSTPPHPHSAVLTLL